VLPNIPSVAFLVKQRVDQCMALATIDETAMIGSGVLASPGVVQIIDVAIKRVAIKRVAIKLLRQTY
jgi:hypothetical protein